MVLSETLLKVVVYLIITVVYVAINSILLREIIKIFNGRDETLATATAISVWMGGVLLVFSFLGDIKIIGWVIAALFNIFFIYLIKLYYYQSWKQSLLIWETWISVLIYLSIFIFAFAKPVLSLIFWGLIPLAINIAFIMLMKMYKNSAVTHILTNGAIFLFINIVWFLLFKIYFPI